MRRARRHSTQGGPHCVRPLLSTASSSGWRRLSALPRRRPGSPATATATASASVHLELFPEIPADWRDAALGERWAQLRDLRRVVTGAIELERGAKRLGSSLQAAVEIFVPAPLLDIAREVDLAELCLVSAGTAQTAAVPDDAFTLPDLPRIGVRVTLAAGERCERCWRVLPEVGHVAGHPDLCQRCAEVVDRLPQPATTG